jgi:predicted alpha/beta-fold hydrolase
MPLLASDFRPAWWLPGPHLQTLWPSLFRQRPPLELDRERLELADGDFLDLSWAGPVQGPLVLVLHGLEGSLESHYAAALLAKLARHGYRACLLHFRGCSGEPNRLPRSYHSGETGDLQTVARHIGEACGRELYAAVGFSLGGNVLLKWLGEQAELAPLDRAVAVSVPYVLNDAALRLGRGFSRLYQRHLIRRLQAKFRSKFRRIACPLDVDIDALDTFHRFDDQVTAPLHGFRGVDDYYRRSSSRQYLPRIRIPTLLLHASDDPFMFPHTVPQADELPHCVQLELAPHGGHVGFVAGRCPGKAEYWLDRRILAWLDGADAAPPGRSPGQTRAQPRR